MRDSIEYSLGTRDTMAYVLAIYMDKVKLTNLAEEYHYNYKEKHFSHEWHTKQ